MFLKQYLFFRQHSTLKVFKCGLQKNMRPFTIIVEGNIGSGKTTFINYLKNNKHICTLTEPIEEWQNVNGHNLFYLMQKDFDKWAFTFQNYVQLSMIKLHELSTTKRIKIMERSIYSARYCFVEHLLNEGILAQAQFAVLDEWFKWLTSRSHVECDLIVYLRTCPEVAFQRIKVRSRKEEADIGIEYVKKIHEHHEDWLYYKSKFDCPAPVLVLDANKDLEAIKEEYNSFQNYLTL